MSQADSYGDPAYALTRHLEGVAFDDAVARARAALGKEGFGVLTEIDVKATLKKKIDVDWRNYLILGACNPKLAHQALLGELGIGVLLPCNVVVAEDADGGVAVSAIDPEKMFSVVDAPGMQPIVDQVRAKLERVIETL